MAVTYETQIGGKQRQIEDPDLVDMMKVRGKLRYSDRQGSQGKLDSGRIIQATNGPWEVIVRTPSGRKEFNSISYVGIDEDENDVYLSAEGFMERFEDSEIIRVRKLHT